MILDYLENYRVYQRSIPELADVIRFVKRVKDQNLPVGRYPVGDGFAMVQEGMTRRFEDADFETHEKYLDVQILLDGNEMCEYTDKRDLQVKAPYNRENDITWYDGKGQRFLIRPDMFYLVYPWDGHKPCCHEETPFHYRKIVAKIRIDKLVHGLHGGGYGHL